MSEDRSDTEYYWHLGWNACARQALRACKNFLRAHREHALGERYDAERAGMRQLIEILKTQVEEEEAERETEG